MKSAVQAVRVAFGSAARRKSAGTFCGDAWSKTAIFSLSSSQSLTSTEKLVGQLVEAPLIKGQEIPPEFPCPVGLDVHAQGPRLRRDGNQSVERHRGNPFGKHSPEPSRFPFGELQAEFFLRLVPIVQDRLTVARRRRSYPPCGGLFAVRRTVAFGVCGGSVRFDRRRFSGRQAVGPVLQVVPHTAIHRPLYRGAPRRRS